MPKLDTYIHCCACQSEWLGNIALFDEEEPCPYCGDKGTVYTGELNTACPHCGTQDGGDCPDEPWERPISDRVCHDLAQVMTALEAGDVAAAYNQLESLVQIECPYDVRRDTVASLTDIPTASETPKCPLTTKPHIHIYVYHGVVECDEAPDCVEVVIEYDDD